jgi:high affinity Mn2+ porin
MRRSSGYCALLAILIAAAFWFIVAGSAAGQPPSAQSLPPVAGDRSWSDGRLSVASDCPLSDTVNSPEIPGSKPGIDRGKLENGKEDEQNENGKEKEEKKEAGEKQEEQKKLLPEGWNFRGQATLIPQFDPGFSAKYSGPNSLNPSGDRQGTITADLYTGVPLWHGAEFHTDLLMWQGFGLGGTFGLEAFPNLDAFKAGTVAPRFMFAHLFVRQTFGLGGEQEDVPDGPLTLTGKQDVSRLTITVGRLSATDIFDKNSYAHDPHTQFLNWALNTNASWDYGQDTIGFTTGIAFELNQPDWALRYGWLQMPGLLNGFTSDDRIFMWPADVTTTDGEFWKSWAMMTELERSWRIQDHPGAIRLQAWIDQAHFANFAVATALLRANPPPPDAPQGAGSTIPAAAFAYRYKYGLGVNWEQEITKNVGMFSRFGWNDGHNVAWTFTDVNWTVSLGLSVKGAAWHRPGDTVGLAGVLCGASSQQQAFLKAGGTGITDGDGNLSYDCEKAVEAYYDFAIGKSCHLAVDYQFFADPAFNRDRGPVNVFGARLHWEF